MQHSIADTPLVWVVGLAPSLGVSRNSVAYHLYVSTVLGLPWFVKYRAPFGRRRALLGRAQRCGAIALGASRRVLSNVRRSARSRAVHFNVELVAGPSVAALAVSNCLGRRGWSHNQRLHLRDRRPSYVLPAKY